MKFKQFTLDPFQEAAVESIDNQNSVVVSAATGTGKTLIADYAIDKLLKKGRRVIYTAPIKALSNQKYRDFKEEYGEENIGLVTGDVTINPKGNVLIMTTEIYRNMLLAKDTIIDFVDYVIFDEIHFINDIERGIIWEESIIFSPNRIRFLCLSATIPNAEEFAEWIESIKEHKVDVVRYEKRAVPLKHHVYDTIMGVTDIEKVIQTENYPDYDHFFKSKKKKRRQKKAQVNLPQHYNLIKDIQKNLPAIFFVFSRKETEKKAEEASKKFNFLTDKERREISELANELIS
ncbi:DEAD/DEAH box helicase, partial [archaeon]|nr:DEAD/DEAH box helicase [archaeon]